MLGLCLRSASSEDPSMDAPEYVPLCDPLHRRTIRKQRNSRCDEKSCRHNNSRRNLPGRLFPASGNRSYCLLHSRKIPRPFPAGGVESIVRREKTGRIGGNKNCRKSVTVCVPHEQQHVKFKRSFL